MYASSRRRLLATLAVLIVVVAAAWYVTFPRTRYIDVAVERISLQGGVLTFFLVEPLTSDLYMGPDRKPYQAVLRDVFTLAADDAATPLAQGFVAALAAGGGVPFVPLALNAGDTAVSTGALPRGLADGTTVVGSGVLSFVVPPRAVAL
jgi:hypothetical protein